MKGIIIVFVNLALCATALGDMAKEQDKLDATLTYMLSKKSMPSISDLEAAENSMSLSLYSCEVQKSVLARLRDLVIMSIAQVKNCMAQRETQKQGPTNYAYYVKNGDAPAKSLREFDNRLLTI